MSHDLFVAQASRGYEQGRLRSPSQGWSTCSADSVLKSVSDDHVVDRGDFLARQACVVDQFSRDSIGHADRGRHPRRQQAITQRDKVIRPPLGRGEFPRQRIVLVDHHLGPAGRDNLRQTTRDVVVVQVCQQDSPAARDAGTVREERCRAASGVRSGPTTRMPAGTSSTNSP